MGKYAVFSKVTLSAVSEDWRLMGLQGPDAGALVAQQTGLDPQQPGEALASESVIALKHEEERYELWVAADKAQKLWLSLAEACQLAGSGHWQLADIRAGAGKVIAATSERFTPQDLNYQLTGAVSFKKGCYTGQEIVARLHYKGKLKKHLYRIGFDASELPTPGTTLADAEGKACAELVQLAWAAKGRAEALAVLPEIESAAPPLGPEGTPVERLSLPYALPTADNNT